MSLDVLVEIGFNAKRRQEPYNTWLKLHIHIKMSQISIKLDEGCLK